MIIVGSRQWMPDTELGLIRLKGGPKTDDGDGDWDPDFIGTNSTYNFRFALLPEIEYH